MAEYTSAIRDIKTDSTPIERAERLSAARVAATGEGQDEYLLLAQLKRRKESLDSEQAQQRSLYQRMDNLYYPLTVTTPGGADHWPVENPAAGSVHVSVNNQHAYVEIPARLQSVEPVENYIATDNTDEEQAAAAACEQVYVEWKAADEFELKFHQACLIKALYGITYGRVLWNAQEKRPTVQIIERPENLFVGYGSSDYTRIDWTVYCYGLSPYAIEEEFGLIVAPVEVSGGHFVPYVTGDHTDPIATLSSNAFVRGRERSAYEKNQVEVYDYWYKKATEPGKKPEIWNAIFVGNHLVSNARHKEFDDIPYLPLRNTFIPGSPYGRPELYLPEQLFREIDERVTEAAAMIHGVVGGQMWQLTGPDAPDEVPANAIPKPNKVAAPGPGNSLVAIQPFVPQFAVSDYIEDVKQLLIEATGLNPVLMGNAPLQTLGSSKAISALVQQYAARIGMPRELAYQWRLNLWKMVAICWERKSRDIKKIIDGRYRIKIEAPDLSPRDALETAQMAINLKQNNIWSGKRAMDATGVDDPEGEEGFIKSEQSDPALNPQAVQAQLTLAAAAAQFGGQGFVPEQGGQNPANGPTPAAGTQSLNGPENAANPPPSSLPTNAQAGNGAKVQTLVQGGDATGRVLGQTTL